MDWLYNLLSPLVNATSWVLLRFHDLWSLVFAPDSGAAWGLSIVGLVVVLRILLFPLFVKQIKAQRGLQALQPQMKEIQKKYKDDRQKQSEEMMKLYKDTGTNPLSSLPADPGAVAVLPRPVPRAQRGRAGQDRRR